MDALIETIVLAGVVQGLQLEITLERGEVQVVENRMRVRVTVEVWTSQDEEQSIQRMREMWVRYGPLQVADLQEEIRLVQRETMAMLRAQREIWAEVQVEQWQMPRQGPPRL